MSASNVRAEIRTDLQIGDDQPLTLIAGPCVIESKELVFEVAGTLSEICKNLKSIWFLNQVTTKQIELRTLPIGDSGCRQD